MSYMQYILPVALLLLAFLLKLLIDQTATVPLFIQAIIELPVDIAFLSASFIAAYTISVTKDTAVGLFAFCIFIIGTIIVVLIWRRCIRLFETNRFGLTVLLGAFNYLICITGLVKSIGLLVGETP